MNRIDPAIAPERPAEWRQAPLPADDAARKRSGLSAAIVSGLAQLAEAGFVAAIGLAIYAVYVQGGSDALYLTAMIVVLALYNIGVNSIGLHKVAAYRRLVGHLGGVTGVWTLAFVALITVAFGLKISESLSRVWLAGWYLGGGAALIGFRLALRAMVLRWTAEGRLQRRAVIVGGGEDAAELIRSIEASAFHDIELLGLFDDRDDRRSPARLGRYPKLGRVADLVDFARGNRLDLVIVSLPLAAERRVLEMLKRLWVLPVDVRLSAHMSKLRFRSRAYSFLGNVPMLDVIDKPISDWNIVLKWVFDKSVALGALMLLSPLMIATALAVKLTSKGPVLFRQQRLGFNNEVIEVLKFRSMYTDMTDARADRLVTRDDPRVTPVGRFIRKTSIDELPQLFNVLKGELSIVGPRPHALHAKAADQLYHEAVDGYFARHRVKPGITGWAQINGWRGETDTLEKINQRVNHDLHYIDNWSILLDLYIVAMTPLALIGKTEAAY